MNDGIFISPVAQSIPFVPISGCIAADNLQNAIEELNTTSVYNSALLMTNVKNTMVSALEIQALKHTDINPDMSFFVDSFEDAGLIDSQSGNYELNANEGYVGLAQGGSFSIKDTTLSQFQEGVFVSGETYLDSGGDGAVRKQKIVEGGITLIEGFNGSLSNISVSGVFTTASSSSIPGTVYAGIASCKLSIDFSGPTLDETGYVQVDLGSGGYNLSASKYLNINVLKPGSVTFLFNAVLIDTTGVTYSFAQANFSGAAVWQLVSLDLTTVTGGINLSSVRYVRFYLYESGVEQTILDVSTGSTSTNTIYDARDGEQTFAVSSNATCQRIRIRACWTNAAKQPLYPLNIGVANIFGTTIGVASIQPTEATGTIVTYTLTLDNPFNLISGNSYKILINSNTPSTDSWSIETLNNPYTGGTYYQAGGDTGRDLNFTLYTPVIKETVYLDNITMEAASTYASTSIFTSRHIPLGLVPTSITKLYWTKVGSYDTVRLRIRFATTEGGLSSATWSSYFTDATGTGNNLTGITLGSWYQYEISWTSGTSSNTDIVKEVNLDYNAAGGSGSATIISLAEYTSIAPTKFIAIWEADIGTGTMNLYISRDGKVTWQSLLSENKGILTTFTSGSGNVVNLKAVLTGNARLYGWGCLCDKEFV